MQKLVNALAIISFGINVSTIAGGVWLYSNRAELIENAKETAIGAVKDILPELIPSLLPGLPGSPLSSGELSAPSFIPSKGESSPLPSTPSLPF